MSNQFPWDRRTVLVFYLLPDADGEPSPATPSLVLTGWSEVDEENALFPSDGAPYLSILDQQSLLELVWGARMKLEAGPPGWVPGRIAQADELLVRLATWILRSSGSWFGYQLEPPEIAGDGTARARGLEAQ